MKKLITEADVEENVLDILRSLDYDVIRGSNEEYLPSGSSALRPDYKDVVLIDKLRYALKKLNPKISEEARELLEFTKGVKIMTYQNLIGSLGTNIKNF